MRTIVISGGTDGMGNALARTYLSRGDTVVVLGRDAGKGKDFRAAAAEGGAGERAVFLQADLSLVAENRRVIETLTARFPVVDVLVLCARHFRSTRRMTAEGFEGTFALEYLSRYLLSHGLVASLERADRPVIVNVSGPADVPVGEIRWDDLGLDRRYAGVAAQLQAGRANDLLGIAFAAAHTAGRTRYVLVNPGMVATSFSGEYDPATAAHVAMMKRMGKPVERGIAPIVLAIDDPPAEPLSAFAEDRRIRLRPPFFDEGAARRLHDLTRGLLPGGPDTSARRAGAAGGEDR
ncbi:hypothetical protein GCM10023196_041540 [Actinoallomurus vinaceus]|uniref:Oxidoreductase n=1 Tax=Actinoallomurus vinaceus TaxID=1080074 RepID=A0ABP8UF65_9ACTN